MIKLFCFSILYSLFALTASAQITWQKTTLPDTPYPSSKVMDDGIIFAGSSNGIVFKSVDDGATWTSATLVGASFVASIAKTPNGTLLVSTKEKGLYKSVDGGVSFQQISGTDGEFRDIIVKGDQIFVSTKDAGVYKSTDNGDNWTQTGYLSDGNIGAFNITNDGTLLVGVKGANGIYRSTDDGATWVKTSFPQTVRVYSLTVGINNAIFAGTSEQFDGVYASNDDGLNWVKVNNLPSDIQYRGNGLGLKNGDILIGSNNTGIFRSTDGGINWELQNNGLETLYGFSFAEAANGDIYAGTGAGLYKNDDYSTSLEGEITTPKQFTLQQNYPNPFNPSTNISWHMNQAGHVSIQIFDLIGREIAHLIDQQISAGDHSVQFEAGNLNSGIYFYRLSTPTQSTTKAMTLIK